MSWLNQSSCLNWTSYDPPSVATYIARQTILRCSKNTEAQEDLPTLKTNFLRLESPADIGHTSEIVGLALWSIQTFDQLETIVEAVQITSMRRPCPIQVVAVDKSLATWTGILLEAGAQIVVSELLFLQKAVERALVNAPTVQKSSHPLLADLPSILSAHGQ